MDADKTKTGPLAHLKGDLLGGITAGIVALPLALGFGVASGIEGGAAAGLYGAIAIGVLAAMFGGTPTQVSGPTGPMTVVVAGLAASMGDIRYIFLAVILGGVVQIVLGVLRMGRVVHYVPYPVVSGFMTGIGAIIIALQLPVMLGADPVKSPIDALAGLLEFIPETHLVTLLLALGTIAIVYISPRITRAIPGSLAALIIGTLAAVLLDLDVETISSIPAGLPQLNIPPLGVEALKAAIPAAIVLGVLGSVDSLLTSLVADRITETRHNSDRELLGQGLGNIAAGLIGGLPGAGATMRTVINVQSGGRTRLSGVVHGLLLLGVLLGLAPLAQLIPLGVLAGILVTVGIGILDYRGLRDLLHVPRGDAMVMLVVLALTVFVDLMWAVGVGVVCSSFLVVKRMADEAPAEPGGAGHLHPEVHDAFHEEPGMGVVRVRESLFFGNARLLEESLSHVHEHEAVIVSLRDLQFLDQSGAYELGDALKRVHDRGVHVYLADLQPATAKLLERLKIAPGIIASEHIVTSAEEARAAIELTARRRTGEPSPTVA